MKKIEKIKRLDSFLIQIFGDKEGLRKSRNLMRGSSLKVLIFKFGKEEGTTRYKKIQSNQKGKGNLNFYVSRFGEKEGRKKYVEKNKRLSVGFDSLKKRGFTDGEIKIIKEKHSRNSVISKDNMIKRYGKKQGEIKWEEAQKNRANIWRVSYWIKQGLSENEAKEKIKKIQTRDLKYFQRKYGVIAGKTQYVKVQKSKGLNKDAFIKKHGIEKWEIRHKLFVYHSSQQYYIDKFGFINGTKIFNKKLEKTRYLNHDSKIQKQFAQELHIKLNKIQKTQFYGEPIKKSYFLNLTIEERKILDQKIIVPDIKIGKFIIEFDGDYWHRYSQEKDNKKDLIWLNRGYTTIRIKELQYKKNKDEVFENLLKKLNI